MLSVRYGLTTVCSRICSLRFENQLTGNVCAVHVTMHGSGSFLSRLMRRKDKLNPRDIIVRWYRPKLIIRLIYQYRRDYTSMSDI